MKILLLFLLLFSTAAQASSVTVKSGEHGAFTRLVLTFPAPVDWVLGRTGKGYGVRTTGPRLPYDLSQVFDLIKKDRISSVWVDPADGDFLFGVGCACHAIPFELGPRILVIDVKDGPAPPQSSFEIGLADGAPAAPLAAPTIRRPRPMLANATGYDWLTLPRTSGRLPAELSETGAGRNSVLDAGLDLNAFRTRLIEEVGRGATRRLVEMESPQPAPQPDQVPSPEPRSAQTDEAQDQVRVGLEDLPGIEITADPENRPALTVSGETCSTAADTEVGTWSGPEDAHAQLALARSQLLAEFDVPEPEKVISAVNTHLYFGFGAEARLLLSAFLPKGIDDPNRRALSYIVDGEPTPENPFLGMQSCGSAAALWALLAAGQGEVLASVNGGAVSQAFLSLPPHLRASLGPDTVTRLLAAGDTANAEVVKQSFERSVAADDPAVALLAADQALHQGDPAAAEAALPSPTTGDAAMSALITQVEARFRQRKAVDAKDILTLQAFAFEHGEGAMKPELDRAITHAAALGNDFQTAFAQAEADATLQTDVWLLLAEVGTDTQLLDHAVGLKAEKRDALPPALRSRMAERLAEAGLPNAARDWADFPQSDAEVAARVALANGDARSALRLLARALPEADAELLATSYTRLGDFGLASETYRAAGRAEDAERLLRWSGEWQPEDGAETPWADLAGVSETDDSISALPVLRAGQSHLDQSLETRRAIETLLETTPVGDTTP
jgi:hypothetical protein